MTNSSILEKLNLKNKTALVTGASRGLGRRFSTVLSTMGANVVLAARNKDKLKETEEIIKNANGECITVDIDVNSEESIIGAFEQAENKYGEISILINNAVNYSNVTSALILNLIYFIGAIGIFYLAFSGARKKGTLINMGE